MKTSIPTLSILSSAVLVSSGLMAFENTKVLPKGIRNLSLKNVATTISSKTTSSGESELLAKPLEKALTFDTIVKGEKGLKKTLLRGFLDAEGFKGDEILLGVNAEMKANVNVVAPVLSYGLSDNLTLALAVPYYSAATRLKTGFIPTPRADEFLTRLTSPEHNLTASAKEVADKFNHMEGELNAKLERNGYQPLGDWQAKGLGDVVLAAKYRFYDGTALKAANLSGVSLATGRIADPDALTSIPFGKGAHQVFTGLILDQPLPLNFTCNQFAKYSHPLTATHELRLKTENEALEVEKAPVKFALGDQLEAGTSLQFEPSWGLIAGLGYLYQAKGNDRYYLDDHPESRAKWEENTSGRAHYVETKFGYSGIGAYQRHEIMVPFTADLEYKKFLGGINTTTNDLLSLNLAIFF